MQTLYWTQQPQLPRTKPATPRTDWQQQAKTTIVTQNLAGNLQSCCGARNPAMSSRLQVIVTFECCTSLVQRVEILLESSLAVAPLASNGSIFKGYGRTKIY